MVKCFSSVLHRSLEGIVNFQIPRVYNQNMEQQLRCCQFSKKRCFSSFTFESFKTKPKIDINDSLKRQIQFWIPLNACRIKTKKVANKWTPTACSDLMKKKLGIFVKLWQSRTWLIRDAKRTKGFPRRQKMTESVTAVWQMPVMWPRNTVTYAFVLHDPRCHSHAIFFLWDITLLSVTFEDFFL